MENAELLQEISNVLDVKFSAIEKRLESIEENVVKTRLHIENSTDKNIQLLAENFVELTKKLNQAIPVADKNLAYEIKVNYALEQIETLKEEIASLKSQIA